MFRRSHLYRPALALLAFVALGGPVFGGGPVFWEVSSQADIIKGDARGVSIAENGTITLAKDFNLVYDTKEAYIWSSATDRAGNIYLGTGHEGRVFKVEPNGTGRLLFDSPELDVYAIATDAQGNVYAGTSPDGKIYKITPEGRDSVFFDPGDKYIWSLAFDPATSTLYAGTGDKGVIYKIDATGKGQVLADTNETNIVSLALDKNRNVIAGTDPSGLVLRVSPDGKTFALFDSPLQEIHALSVGADGSIYALGINQQASSKSSSSLGTSTTTTLSSDNVITISTSDDDDSSGTTQTANLSGLLTQSSSASQSSATGAKSAVFRILPDGGSEVYWQSKTAVGFGLDLMADGNVLLGTGEKGRIYKIAPDHTQTLLIQSPEDQTSTLLTASDKLYATSSNLGRLYRISPETVSEGTYLSPVHDTKFAGQWGIINWRGSGRIEIRTRSGNTESPDATWSDWSPAYANASGDQVTSPRARFIQWRAVLKSAAAGQSGTTRPPQATGADSTTRLQSVVIAYLPRNQAPEVGSVTILPPGIALQETPLAIDPSIASSGLDPQLFGLVSSVPPRRFFQKGARSITWQGTDPNSDTLTYKILYRTIGDNEWHVLADNLSVEYYTIDGNRLPDGTYHFKVVASDQPSNPESLALTNEEVSDNIEIDNTPPSIKVNGPTVKGQTAEVGFETEDLTSRVVRGEYSVDGGDWKLVFPADGIADSSKESFKVRVSFDRPGEHVIAFRVADSSSNVGTSKVTVTAQ